MSRTAINEILDRSLLDEEFRLAVQSTPERALAEYDLTAEEKSALVSRSYEKTTTLAGAPQIAANIISVTTLSFFITTIVYLSTTNNLVAIRPNLDDDRQAELVRRGEEIRHTTGDRTEPIKELLARMR